MKKVILINLVILVFVVCIVEYVAFFKVKAELQPIIERQGIEKGWNLKYTKTIPFKYENYKRNFRKPFITESNNGSIILFGCSYTEGTWANDEDTLAGQLSKLTGRSVYNRGVNGSGTQFMYYQLSQDDIKNEIPDAQYIIYTFIDDHMNRLYNPALIMPIYLRFKVKDDRLVEQKPLLPGIYSLFIVKKFKAWQAGIVPLEDKEKLFMLVVKESVRLAYEKYPNSKFIILVYPSPHYKKSDITPYYSQKYEFRNEVEQAFRDAGIIVINAEDLMGKKLRKKEYRFHDLDHPNERAWKELAPLLVKELEL